MISVAKAFVLSFVAVSSLALPAQAPAETVGLLLLRLQEQSAAPLVQHCVAEVPELKRPLEVEYSQFTKRFRKAAVPLRARIKANKELSKPASPELIRQFKMMDPEFLTQFRSTDPHVACARLKENLSKATEQSIQRNMESAFAQYTALARQSR